MWIQSVSHPFRGKRYNFFAEWLAPGLTTSLAPALAPVQTPALAPALVPTAPALAVPNLASVDSNPGPFSSPSCLS